MYSSKGSPAKASSSSSHTSTLLLLKMDKLANKRFFSFFFHSRSSKLLKRWFAIYLLSSSFTSNYTCKQLKFCCWCLRGIYSNPIFYSSHQGSCCRRCNISWHWQYFLMLSSPNIVANSSVFYSRVSPKTLLMGSVLAESTETNHLLISLTLLIHGSCGWSPHSLVHIIISKISKKTTYSRGMKMYFLCLQNFFY